MILKKVFTVILFSLCLSEGFSQERSFFASQKNFFWVPVSFSGEFRTTAHYRKREILTDYLNDTQNSSRFSVGGLIHSESYFWHPNFLLLNIEAEYNPDFIKENFIVIPDRSENRTMKRLNIKSTLFNTKIISLNTHLNLSQTYSNRENLTNIKTNRKQWGSMLSFRNKTLPINLSFNKTKWEQEEIETTRVSNMEQLNFTGRTSKSFYNNDKHDLVYSHDEYSFNYINLYQTNTVSDYITLNNNFNFDNKKKYNFRSRVSYRNQTGTFDFKKFQADENLRLNLPERFTFNANYNYFNLGQETQNTATNNVKLVLRHKLYLSLNTNIFYEFRNTEHTAYSEKYNAFGGNLYYTKKIILKGRLNLSYNYRRQNFHSVNPPAVIQIINENHILSDGQIELLDRPYIQISSVVVTDISGSIIYQENLDYILTERNNYIEIQRFPGGQIANNAGILVSYTVNLPETYDYDYNYNKFSSSISIWNRTLELYFNASKQNYLNLEDVDLLILNYFTQYRYGIRTDFKFAAAGVEFDNYDSSIIPYKMTRYYLSAQKSLKNKILMSVNGNIRDYYLLDDDIRQLYADISAKTVYRFYDLTKASLELGYRKQIGTGIDLDLLTARLEISTQFRELYATLGFEKYNKNFLNEINNYGGIYFRLIRKF